MKIAVFVSSFPLTSETFVLNQITGLIDRGHDVYIYTSSRKTQKVHHADVQKYKLLERTFYHRPKIKLLKRILLLFKCLKWMVISPSKTLDSINVAKYGLSVLNLKRLYHFDFWQEQDHRHFDILYCHFGPNGITANKLRQEGYISGKIVTVFHAYDLTKYPKTHGANVYESLFQQGDLFLPITQYALQKLLDLGCPEDKLHIHHMGVNCEQFEYTPNQPSPNKPIHVVSVGRLVEKKGFDEAIRSIAIARKHGHDFHLTFIGDGPLRDSLEALTHELKLDNYIQFAGWKIQDEITEILKNSHILLCPSVTSADGDEEGLPVVLMEALSKGLPVVTTQHAGIPELIQDNETGMMVPERDNHAIAEKLSILIEQPDMYLHIAQTGRSVIERDFNIMKLNDSLVKIFENLLKNLHSELKK